jgi:hypothetical protein
MAGGPTGVGGPGNVNFDSMQQLVGAGDMESALLAFGIERAQNMEKLVKAKIADMRERNGAIQELQQAMQTIRSAKPAEDGSTAASPEMTKALAVLEKNGIALPTGLSSPEATKVKELEHVDKMVSQLQVSSDTAGAQISWKPGTVYNGPEWMRAIGTMNNNPNIGYTGTHANWSSSGRYDYVINNGGFQDLKNDISSELTKAKAAPATLTGKKDSFDDLITNMQSKIDELTSNDQLDMIQLQSMVSKQNNSIEMVSNLQNKFAGLKDKIVGNMR